MKFDTWLLDQRRYQASTYKVDYPHMRRDVENRTAYVSMNLTAAMIEMGEAYQEVPWKPWAIVDKTAIWRENREKFIGEIVDVLFFLANALAAVDCTDEELAIRYNQKMAVNVKRQDDGYDGDHKCKQCRRAFDDLPDDHLTVPIANVGKFCNSVCAHAYRLSALNPKIG